MADVRTLGQDRAVPLPSPMSDRLYGIDVGRIVCAFLVVLLHLAQFTHAGGVYNTPLQVICRVAVPFFFIASGYFLKVPDRLSAAVVLRPLQRVGVIYVFWALAYLAVFGIVFHTPTSVKLSNMISGGRAFQLWFLPALLLAMIVVPAAWITLGRRGAGLLCLLAAVLGTALTTYAPGITVETVMFARLLCAPLFVYLGVLLAHNRYRPALAPALALTLVGLVGLLAEEYTLSRITGQPPVSHDFMVSTYVYGFGAFLAFLNLRGRRVAMVGEQGRYSLGIYILQLFFIFFITKTLRSHTLAALAGEAVLVFALAYVSVRVVSLIPVLRRTLM